MKSALATANTNALASQYNDLRDDAYGGAQLLVHQQASPGMTVHVEPGIFYLGPTQVVFAGGDSPTMSAPSSDPRIDLLTIDSSGVLALVTGAEAGSPVAPTYVSNKIVVAQIYNVVGETIIYDNANQTAGQGYITDVRPFLQTTNPTFTDELAGGKTAGVTYTNNSGRTQMHIITIAIDVGGAGSGNGKASFVTNAVFEYAFVQLYSVGNSRNIGEFVLIGMVRPGVTYQLMLVSSGTVNSLGPDHWNSVTL